MYSPEKDRRMSITIVDIQREQAATRRWQGAVAEAALPFEARWTLAALKRADADIYQRLQDQRSLFVIRPIEGRSRKAKAHLLPARKSDVGGTWLVWDTCLGFLFDVCEGAGRPAALEASRRQARCWEARR